jgi:phosphoribosylamine--glycine ligase
MHFLGIGDYCDLGSLYLRLQAEGHEVRVSISERRCQNTLSGLVTRTDDWKAELPWIREAGNDGIILFENVAASRGASQEHLRAQGYQVIGGCSFGDRLENDRAYAQTLLRSFGFSTASFWEFDNLTLATKFIEAHPGRYVLKFSGEQFGAADNYVGRLKDGSDVHAVLLAKVRQSDRNWDAVRFILMSHLEGIEMGVGAYFDGERFLSPACLDWEHKKFFPGDLGELTGEMGTVVTFDRTGTFFRKTLEPLGPLLKENGYCGYINLNTIVNDHGIWPLEFTCRFGYPGYSILEALQVTTWSNLFKGMASRSGANLQTRPGFAVGIVLTTPPFPYVRAFFPEPIGLPILFDGQLSARDHANLHFGEMALEGGQLVTAGYHGWTMVVTGTGTPISAAQAEAYHLAGRVVVPNVRYRNDIGTKLIQGEYAAVERLGLLGD